MLLNYGGYSFVGDSGDAFAFLTQIGGGNASSVVELIPFTAGRVNQPFVPARFVLLSDQDVILWQGGDATTFNQASGGSYFVLKANTYWPIDVLTPDMRYLKFLGLADAGTLRIHCVSALSASPTLVP